MHAFLITGGTKEGRIKKINELLNERNVSAFDRIVVKSEDAIGVSTVREFIKKLSLTPFHGNVLAGIIEDASTLTSEAQNALLKTLEEPSPKSFLYLMAVSADVLLPTIVSRCQVISLGSTDQYTKDDLFRCFETLEQMRNVRIGERIKMIDAIATDREAAKAWVERAIASARQELLVHTRGGIDTPPKETIPPIPIVKLLHRLLTAQKQLAANVTPKLVLDAVFLANTPQ